MTKEQLKDWQARALPFLEERLKLIVHFLGEASFPIDDWILKDHEELLKLVGEAEPKPKPDGSL